MFLLKRIISVIVILLILLLIVSIFLVMDWGRSSRKTALDFADCLASGYSIQDSYPRQCRDGAGQLFIEDVGNLIAKSNLVTISNLKPNSEVRSPVSIEGSARGLWYFEGVFPIKIKNIEGKILGTGQARAQGEWTTDDFVDFKAEIFFLVTTTTQAILELDKDNPSGMPQNDDSVFMPITLHPTVSSTSVQVVK